MGSDLVSILILFDGADEYYTRCISSILDQNYSEIEIVVVGKKEPPHPVLEGLVYTFIECNFKSEGYVAAIDHGLEFTHGEHVLIIGSNSYLFPDCVNHLFIQLTESKKTLLLIGHYQIKSGLAVIRLPDESDISETRIPRFFSKCSVIKSYSELISLDTQQIGIVNDLLMCIENEEKQLNRPVWKELYYLVRRSLFFVVNYRLIRDNSQIIKGFRNKYYGKRCFIIGNGPSLTIEDLDRLQGEYTFGVNGIIKMYGGTDWRPTFFVISDHLAMRDLYKKLPSSGAEYSFFKVDYKKFLEKKESNAIFYRSRSAFFDGYPPNFSEDVSKYVYSSSTVSYICLQFALYFGFKEIYLLGMDHSFPLQKTKNGFEVKNAPRHFYDERYKDGDEWYVSRLDLTEESYLYCKKIVEMRGVKVYNATRGGELEIFERVNFDSLFDS